MTALWDFCLDNLVVENVPPEQTKGVSMNGWHFAAKPNIPYQYTFILTVQGLQWYLGNGGLYDDTTDPTHNARRFEEFVRDNGTWNEFNFPHPHLGMTKCKFANLPKVPKSTVNSNGLIDAFEVQIVQSNVSHTTGKHVKVTGPLCKVLVTPIEARVTIGSSGITSGAASGPLAGVVASPMTGGAVGRAAGGGVFAGTVTLSSLGGGATGRAAAGGVLGAVVTVTPMQGGGASMSAPVLSFAAGHIVGSNPMEWDSTFTGYQTWDSATNTGDKHLMRWRVNSGSWTTETEQPLDDELLTGGFNWPLWEAVGYFADLAFIEVQEQRARYSGGVETMRSPWSNIISDTMADMTPSGLTFADLTNQTVDTDVTFAPYTVASISGPPFAAPISVSGPGSPVYKIGTGSFTNVPGTTQLGDVITVKNHTSVLSGTDMISSITIGKVTATFKSTTTASGVSITPLGTFTPGSIASGAYSFGSITWAGTGKLYVDINVWARTIGSVYLTPSGGGADIPLNLGVRSQASGTTPMSAHYYLDGLAAGTYTLKVSSDSTFNFSAAACEWGKISGAATGGPVSGQTAVLAWAFRGDPTTFGSITVGAGGAGRALINFATDAAVTWSAGVEVTDISMGTGAGSRFTTAVAGVGAIAFSASVTGNNGSNGVAYTYVP